MKRTLSYFYCVLVAIILAQSAQAAFTYTGGVLNASQTYNGLGADSGLNPWTIGSGYNSSTNDDYIGNSGGTGSLTVLSGTLTINNDDFKVANNGGAVGSIILGADATLNINNIGQWGGGVGQVGTGILTISNNATVNWYIAGSQEQRLMIGNGTGAYGTLNLYGGTLIVTNGPTLSDDQRQFRVGSDGGTGTLNLNAGTVMDVMPLPFFLGGKYTGMNSTPAITQGTTVSTMNIGNGSFIMTAICPTTDASKATFTVGSSSYVNFAAGGTGSLSLTNWTSSDYAALVNAGRIRVGGATATMSNFLYSSAHGQGILQLANGLAVGAATASPANNVYAGTPLTLSATTVGASSFQWQTDSGSSGVRWSDLGGATNASYVLDTTGLLGTYEYQLIASDGANSVTSGPVSLTVAAASAPVFVSSSAFPSATTNYVGGTQSYSASYTGTLPIAYQWQVSPNPDGSGAVNIAGATHPTLVLENLQTTNSGYYSLQASNNVSPYVSRSPWTQLVVSSTLVSGDLKLWYNQPGTNSMIQGLMLGNGRLGAIVLGNPTNDDIVLNEDSLWTGNTNLSGVYDSSSTGAGNMGYYQLFGNLLLSLPSQANYTDYYRELNLSNAVATVRYQANGVTYTREIFCSHPDQVMVMELTADTPNAYTGTLRYQDGHSATSVSVPGGITAAGTLANGEQYAARISVQNTGGTLISSGGVISFTNCSSLTVLVALGTDYVMDYSKSYHSGISPATTVANQIAAASAKSYTTLKAAHVADFESYFNRVSINLGPEPPSRVNLPTDQRIAANTSDDDHDLEALLFQYGRYLMLSSSRSNGVPSNLQGLWNDTNVAPWHSDYHTDINIEMNYWGAEDANLSECTEPLFKYIQSQLVPWTWATSNAFGTRGWSVRTSLNLNGGMGWNWDLPANDWMCMPIWEHYLYTGDTNFLRNYAYPIMKEICEFWQGRLKAMPDGTLVSPDGWSPEHGPAAEDGVTYDQELVWDAFDTYIRASTILNTDAVYRATISNLQSHLLKPRIGPWGELREWLYTPDSPTDTHRHTSHLVGVYPGHQITPDGTPALARAAAVSLIARGDPGEICEWQFVNRAAIWARLLNPEEAQHRIALLFAYPCLEPNLLCRYSDAGGGYDGVPQLDGNFGILGAISEMLLQSYEGKIVLLPALPAEWPCGSVKGLCAEGGFSVDMTWTNGALISATIHSITGTHCLTQYGSQTNQFTIPLGGSVQVPLTKTNGQPAGPVIVGAAPANGQMALTWRSSVTATSYNVKQSTNYSGPFTVVASGLSTTNYTVSGLVNGITNYFVVSAANAAGEGLDSIPVAAVPGVTIASAPTGLSATPLDSMAVLKWNAVPGASAYNVKYSTTSGSGYSIYGIVPGATNYSVFGLTNGVTYYFVVSAVVNGVESTNSTQLAVVPVGAPSGLTAVSGNGDVALRWNAYSGATSYNVKRSFVSGGPYSLIASTTTTNFTDTNALNGTAYYYVVSMIYAGNESADSSEVGTIPAPNITKLTGAIIGTPGSYNNLGNTITNVFDNNLNTYFDGPNSSNGNGCWAGLDFGNGVSNVISLINYCPRATNPNRMVGGVFQGANLPDFSDAVTLATVTTQPLTNVFTTVSIVNPAAFRYVRYLSPDGGWGNVAEVQFYGHAFISTLSAPLNASVSSRTLQFLWPYDHIGWHLEVQTNPLGAGLGTNWEPVAGSTATNQLSVPINARNGSVFFRLVYP